MAQHKRRKTPLAHGNRPGTNRPDHPQRPPGEIYTVDSYRRAITRGADKANFWAKGGRVVSNEERIIPRWHPHQLRHTAATKLRREFGVEVAQVVLGHRHLDATEIYAERNLDKAREIVGKVG